MGTTDTKECPNCKSQAYDLLRIDTGMRVALQAVDYPETIHPAVCSNCYQSLSSLVSQGAKLRAQKIAKDENKRIIWRKRIDLIKRAREEMVQKNLSGAAAFYEKYIGSLAGGFEVQPNQLVPSLFNNPQFKKELVLVAYAYLDMFKIYDQHPQATQKFQDVTQQLQLFSNNPSVRNGILKKLRKFKPYSKHPEAIDNIIKTLDRHKGSHCFIATAAFGVATEPEVILLCKFRDQILLKSKFGMLLVNLYYKTSPPIAFILEQSDLLKKIVRVPLRALASMLNYIFNLKK